MKVKVYGTDTCIRCKLAKNYLTTKGVPFESIDIISMTKDDIDKLTSGSVMSLPVIVVGDKVTVGFNQKELEKLLKEVE